MNAQVNMDGAERTKSCEVEPTKRYRHQALDTSTRQIRLIKLHPGQPDKPQCDISVFELDNAPRFVALSYTWGPPSPQFDIMVNGESLSIRENLFQFFQAYLMITEREPRPRRHFYCDDIEYRWSPSWCEYLWIDQICIDQSSVRERNHQVGMMASIYAGCYGTIIWLGTIRGCPDAPLLLGDSTEQDYRYTARTLSLSEVITSISGHEYFTRLWIVQEIVLSTRRKVLCSHATAGPVWINWDQLLARAQCCPEDVSSKSALYLLGDHEQKNQMDLSYAIKTFNESRCQDPRDKVYGLTGLVKENQRLQIDYGKSLQELLLDVMTIFYVNFTQAMSNSHSEYYEILAQFGTNLGIMSASLDTFLHDSWIKPNYDQLQDFVSESCDYYHIRAMGFFPNDLDQSITSQSQGLDSHGIFPSERVSGYLWLSRWVPTKGSWWYKVAGITYEIYSLSNSNYPSHEDAEYYGKRVRRARQERRSQTQPPSWAAIRRSLRKRMTPAA